MMFPPSLVWLRVHTPNHAWPRLWLPLFLLWPLLFVLLVLLALGVLLIAVVLDPRRTPRAFELAGTLFGVVCGLRGLHIDVASRHSQFLIAFH